MKKQRASAQLTSMFVLTFATQLLTVIKASRTASIFGVSMEMDVYNFINSIAGFIFSFLSAGVSTVLLPAFAKKKANTVPVNSFITMLYGVACLLMIGATVLMKPIMRLMTDYSADAIRTGGELVAAVLLGQYLTAIASVWSSYLHCNNQFRLPQVAGLAMSVAITAVVYLYDGLTMTVYVYATLFFLVMQYAVIGGSAVWSGFRYRPALQLRDAETIRLFRIFVPSLLGGSVYQLTTLTDSLLTSSMGQGQLSVLSYAGTISGMINTIICGNVVTFLYPRIAGEKDEATGKKNLFQYMTFFAAMMCAVLVAFVAGGRDAIRILFQRGEFTPEATHMVYWCVFIYLLGFPMNVMRDLMYRYYYGKGNTKGTFYNGLAASILNILFSIPLSWVMGVYGVVLGTTITSVCSLTMMLLRFRKNYHFDGYFGTWAKELGKITLGTAAGLAVTAAVKAMIHFPVSLAVSVLAAVLGLVAFGAVLLVSRATCWKMQLNDGE